MSAPVAPPLFRAGQDPQPALIGWYGAYNCQRVVSGSSTNATNVKPSPGGVGGFFFICLATYTVYFKFYDKISAPVVGTDTPLFTVPVQAAASAGGAGVPSFISCADIFFANGVSFAITKGVADSDSTSVAANDLHGFFQWS